MTTFMDGSLRDEYFDDYKQKTGKLAYIKGYMQCNAMQCNAMQKRLTYRHLFLKDLLTFIK